MKWLLAQIHLSFWLMRRGSDGVCHGPTEWPRGKICSLSLVRQTRSNGGIGWNLWIYTPRDGEPTTDYKGIKYRNTGRCIEFCVVPK